MELRTIAKELARAGLKPRFDEPIARHGFWRVGGPADLLVDVETPEQLALVLSTGAPVTCLGRGTNLLAADAGIRGIVVRLGGAFRSVEVREGPTGPEVEAGAGVSDAYLLARLAREGLGGLGALAGVPGTLGGAIRMNAGTRLGEVGERVIEVELALPGEVRRVPAAELHFRYRCVDLPSGAIITRARLSLDRDGFAAEQAAIRAHLAYRRRTQPLDQPSCGSVFKNPPGDHAGRLIEAVGLKGHTRGGARFSPLHANFIVNTGGATAADIHALLTLARRRVHERFGVVLEPEVHPVGDWPAGAWPLPSLA